MKSLSGDPLGTHRVLLPRDVLPQPAERLDASDEPHYETEIAVDVETLNIDAASFRQMEDAVGGDPIAVGRMVMDTVQRRGKQHNPVTGSGGMLLGSVRRVGALVQDRGVRPGDRIATLASLSLTPLRLTCVRSVRPVSAQVDVDGVAYIFASAPFARMPVDIPERLALAVLDVAGAAPQVARLCHPGETVVVFGAGGKSGLLCCAEARRRVGAQGRIIGLESSSRFADDLRGLGICDEVAVVDARNPVAVHDVVGRITDGRGADLTLSCVNVPGVELSAVVATRDGGRVYYFAMSTNFAAVAQGAEGIGRAVELYIGNGYAHGHAEHTLALVRSEAPLASLLAARYG